MVAKAKVPPSRNGSTDVQIHAPRKLDVACGLHKQQGFKGIDIAPDSQADIVWDLFEFPWPIKTGSVHEVFCSHFIEHVPHHHPGWEKDGWFMFFDELHRIMRKGATAEFHHPYAMNTRAFWDPTHVRFIHETTWYYLSQEWREMQEIDHYPCKHDFEVVTIDTMGTVGDYPSRSPEVQAFQRTHYWNVFGDLRALIKKR